mgnify:FL=1|tara:strand:- start:6759 stop:7766 length:1008 start_codon:yes stop_codon:yes gene_type:complete
MFARHFAANFVNLLIVGVLVFAGAVYWGKGQYVATGPLSADTNFEVMKGDRFRDVADRLETAGVIKNAVIFKVGARYAGQDNKLKFGDYAVPAAASMEEVVALITSGRAISEQVTFPEGFTSFQIVERLNAIEGLTGELVELPAEGSLAPNTYAYIKGDTRQKVLDKMVGAQQSILDAAWENRAPDLPFSTKEEALIIASIIEKETPQKAELALVSGVIMNRLRKDMPLGMDSTTVYEFTAGNPKNMRSIRRSDLVKDTKYNTRRYAGLPPTPIGNPGQEAIQAALSPEASEYLFFVADGTGGHAFAKTLKEHNANVAVWRKVERERKAKAAQAN